jgi:DNA-binding transcriptional LysR family regulator
MHPNREDQLMDIIEALHTFVRIVETGSFSAVARENNASPSRISRQVTQLESHSGLRLLHRTTRQLSLTDDGENLRDHAVRLREVLESMEASPGRQKSSPAGHVRVAAPVSLGLWLVARRYWSPVIPDFRSSW